MTTHILIWSLMLLIDYKLMGGDFLFGSKGTYHESGKLGKYDPLYGCQLSLIYDQQPDFSIGRVSLVRACSTLDLNSF